MIEPNMIRRMASFLAELDKGAEPQAEDFINKDDLLSNDIFCIVFTALTLCNPEFAQLFKHSADPDDRLIDFDREKFFQMLQIFLVFISHDPPLAEALKELIGLDKYAQGIGNPAETVHSPTLLSAERLEQLVERLTEKPANVNELLNVNKTVKFHKITSARQIERFKRGELKPDHDFQERPSFRQKIKTMTSALSWEVERSMIRKQELMSKGRVDEDGLDREEMFEKIPSKLTITYSKRSTGG